MSALRQKILRALYHAIVWSNDTVAIPENHLPLQFRWLLVKEVCFSSNTFSCSSWSYYNHVKCQCWNRIVLWDTHLGNQTWIAQRYVAVELMRSPAWTLKSERWPSNWIRRCRHAKYISEWLPTQVFYMSLRRAHELNLWAKCESCVYFRRSPVLRIA